MGQWTADGFVGWSADGYPTWTADGGFAGAFASGGAGKLDAYDAGGGVIKLAWGSFPGLVPDSYNVYVNGVLNQNVTQRLAQISGLQFTTYNPSAVAASTGNSLRPRNMPPNGLITPGLKYDFKVVAVKGGFEVAATLDLVLEPQPHSIALVTPMKRLWPFPNTGLD